jgi:glutamate formiminotransferase / 5-formyltetrahydrofolate cyclo-ligase
MLLAVPNFSEGRNAQTLEAIGDALRPVNVHTDPDHNRTVFTLHGEELVPRLAAAAAEAIARIDITTHRGEHPRIGAIDVAPIVYTHEADRGAAVAQALVLADALGELGLPVFLYGVLAGGRTRAELRRGGPAGLAERMRDGLAPDAGPRRLHPTAGAVLVAARPPLVAFNVELAAPATLDDARAIAARIREGGTDGLPGVRAIGLHLQSTGTIQVSTNIEEPGRASAADVVAAIRRIAGVRAAELVALAPAAALEGFPEDVPLRNRATIEGTL